jgi:uncharacterized membrane protein required for colicin V production
MLAVIFLFHVVSGFSRGLAKQLFDIVGLVIVILISLWGSRMFSYVLAGYIDPENIASHHEVIQNLGIELALEQAPRLIAGVITFLILFLLLSLAFRLFSSGFRWVNRIPVVGFFNRIGGGVLGALLGAVFAYIIIAGLSLIPIQFFMNALEGSEIVFFTDHYLRPVAEELRSLVVFYYTNLNS